MHDTFNTIVEISEGIYKEKGSKFFAFAYPVISEDEILEKITVLKKKHFNARHHCYAYRLGANGEVYKANDDNEPVYTAGKPILGQIDSFNLTNILIVVVRYFGGTLLGRGGLVTAYKLAAQDALKNAKVVIRDLKDSYLVECPYEKVSLVMSVLKDLQIEIVDQNFDLTCSVNVMVRKGLVDQFLKKIEHIENTKIKVLHTT